MKDININANNIGTSVIAEEANVTDSGGTVAHKDNNNETEIINSILNHCNAIANQQQQITNEQLQAFSIQIVEAMNKIKSEKHSETKKSILANTIEKIKDVIGETGHTFEAIIKLAALLGFK